MSLSEEQIDYIAATTHQANKLYCQALGDYSQVDWDEAPEWQKQSARNGVVFIFDNPEAPVSANHESWMKEKEENGWVYGHVKDPEKKEHPCMVPFDQLPESQQFKDTLFRMAFVNGLAMFVE